MNDIEQGSPAWLKSRLGKATGSRMSDVMDKLQRGGEGAKRIGYRRELVFERLTNRAIERFVTKAMQWGIDKQPEAERAYSLITGNDVAPAPFVPHPGIAMSGASPDGYVNDDGLIEIKCPESVTHIQTLLSGEVPNGYMHQIQFQLACTGRDWCDFVSFDPRMPATMQIFFDCVHRDQTAIDKLEAEVKAFLETVDDDVNTLVRLHASV